MAAFIRALQQKDRETFLSFFPTSGPWYYMSTITQPPSVTSVEPAVMKADFEQRRGMYEALFDADGDDSFRDWVMNAEVSAWVESAPGRFVRQKMSGRDSVYVEWQREGDRWVVRTIAEPAG